MKLFAGNEAYLHFYLSNFTDKQSLVDAVRNIPYCGHNTNMTGGLRLTRLEIFNATNGDRSNASNVIVLITDGNPTREVQSLHDEVRRIKRLNIRIVGVGITDSVSVIFVLFQTNDKGRLAPLTCHEYNTVKHIKTAQ